MFRAAALAMVIAKAAALVVEIKYFVLDIFQFFEILH